MKAIKLLFVLVILSSCNNPYQKGETLYQTHCANCHGKDGEGLRKLYPPINSELYEKYRKNISCMIRYGSSDTLNYNGVNFTAEMPPNEILTDIEIVNIKNFLDWKYSSKNEYNSLKDVKKELATCN